MSSITISLIAFALVFGGALLGTALRAVLPQHHVSAETKDVVRLGVGLVATTAALVLGLLISSAKGSFDTQNSELTDMASRIVLLDRVLAHYGPEAQVARDELRNSVIRAFDWIASSDGVGSSQALSSSNSEILYDKVQSLSPKDEAQRSLQAEALSLVISLGQTRWLIASQRANSVSVPLLAVLIFWLSVIFTSFGLFAPRNTTAIATLLVCALSVSGAIFLILAMYSPYAGLIHVSAAPLRAALSHLGH